MLEYIAIDCTMIPFEEVLLKEGYESKDEILRENALLIALTKVELYRSESESFQLKYGSTLKEYDDFLHTEKGKEDFKAEEDFEDWEFAENALKWWNNKISEIKNVSDTH
jgi:hypothetical protein